MKLDQSTFIVRVTLGNDAFACDGTLERARILRELADNEEMNEEMNDEIERLTDSVRECRARHSAYVIARCLSTGPTVARRIAEMKVMREDARMAVDLIRVLEQRHNDNFARRGY